MDEEKINIETPDAETDMNTTAENASETVDEAQTGEEVNESSEQSAEPETKEKTGFFGKKKDKKDKEIEELTAKIDDLNDRAKRNLAEFDNYRKRTEKEKAQTFDLGAKSIIEKILPVIDNFERGLAAVPEAEKDSSFVDGMNKVYKAMVKELNDAGLEAIEAKGQPFDPNLHNAVMHVEDESLGENVVAEEFQKGYTYKGSVVRHSMVQVAN